MDKLPYKIKGERTMTMEELKELIKECKPMGGNNVYFRPFSGGNPEKAEIFLAGINPATVITESDVKFAEYRRMLLQPGLKDFDELYNTIREANGNTEESPTRVGIRSFSEWLRNESGGKEVLETDINAYPTPNARCLKKKSNTLYAENGVKIFFDLMEICSPKILIIHSENRWFLINFVQNLQARNIDINFQNGIKDLKKLLDTPIENRRKKQLEYLNNKQPFFRIDERCDVFICPHLSFQRQGSREFFEMFKKKLDDYLKENVKNA
jgi:hypothetical protein